MEPSTTKTFSTQPRTLCSEQKPHLLKRWGALVGMLSNISSYNLPFDYVKQQEETIKNMTVGQ
ncbi:MAG: hypothetical protein ABFC28_02590 [Rikenellaceae bacterium]